MKRGKLIRIKNCWGEGKAELPESLKWHSPLFFHEILSRKSNHNYRIINVFDQLF